MTRLFVLLFSLAVPPALAADRDFAFAFTPTQTGEARVKETHPIHTVPVLLQVVDGRPEGDRERVGTRHMGDDTLLSLGLDNDLLSALRPGLERKATLWGLRIAPVRADRVLTVSLDGLRVHEAYEALGSSYEAHATLSGVLADGAGAALWEGGAVGDATRYGRTGSTENTNEVLSDALVEAMVRMLNDAALQAAWVGAPAPGSVPAPAASPAPAEPVAVLAPEALLSELQQLQAGGLSEDSLLLYVAARALTRPLGVSELVAWKGAGIPEAVIQRAMALPVR
ncbi:MAG: hypothetical protein ABIO70_30820 [Pseudomonadota bacterium]